MMDTHVEPRKSAGWSHPIAFGGLVIALALLAFVAWAASAPLSGAVVALGLVKTEQNRKAVQHPEAGIIKTLLVRDGDLVKAGQAVIELDNVSTDSNYQLLREITAFETIKRDRLDAEQQLAAHFPLDPGLNALYGSELVSPAYQRELRIFQARRTSLDQQLAMLAEQLKAIELERRALLAQVKADQSHPPGQRGTGNAVRWRARSSSPGPGCCPSNARSPTTSPASANMKPPWRKARSAPMTRSCAWRSVRTLSRQAGSGQVRIARL